MAKKGKKGQKTGFGGSQAKGGQKGGTRDMWGRKITIPNFWYSARFLPPPQKKKFLDFQKFPIFQVFQSSKWGGQKRGSKNGDWAWTCPLGFIDLSIKMTILHPKNGKKRVF
jgi:hypothetical protein